MLFSTSTPVLSPFAQGRAFRVSPKVVTSWALAKARREDLSKHDINCQCDACLYEYLNTRRKLDLEEFSSYEEIIEAPPIAELSDVEITYWTNWFANAFPNVNQRLIQTSGPMYLVDSLNQASPNALGITMLTYLEHMRDWLEPSQIQYLEDFHRNYKANNQDYLQLVQQVAMQ